jgi:HEAT repeat protein
VRQAAERELAEAGAKAVPGLRRALARDGEPVDPRVDALVKKLSASSWKEREQATRDLVLLGQPARSRLSTYENAADVEVAWRVKSVLAELKEKETEEAAAGAYADAAICRLLGAAGDGESAGLILGALKGVEGTRAEAALDLRLSVLGALADLKPALTAEQAERATEEGLKLLREQRHRRTMGAVLKSLGRLKSPAAVAPLKALVDEEALKDLHVKRGALAALASIGRPESMRVVIDALKSSEPYLREAALQVLAVSGLPAADYDPASGPASEEIRRRLLEGWERQRSAVK